MSTQVADIFVKVGAKLGEFNAAMVSVETKLNTLSKQLKLDVKADSTNVLTMVRELKTLEAEAKRLQSGVLSLQVKNADPAAIKAMDDQLAGVARRMEILNAAIADNQQKWQKLADVGNKLTMGITAPLVAAATAIGAFAVKTADLSEKLDNMSKQTGLNTTLLQQLKFIADQSGLSFEAIANASTMVQRKLMGVEQDTGNVAEAFKRLGVNARGSDGQLRSMNDLFPELIRALQNMGNATERTMLASQIFGRGASDLLPILAMSAAEFENAKNRASEFGLVLDSEALAAAARMDAAMDDLKSRFAGFTQQLAMDFIPILTDDVIPAMESLVKWARSVVEWFEKLNPVAQATIGIFVGLVAAVGPLLTVLSKIVIVLPALNIWLGTIGLTMGRLSVYLVAITAIIIGALWLYDRLTGRTREQADAIRAENEAMTRNAVARAQMTQEQLDNERVRARAQVSSAEGAVETARREAQTAQDKYRREWWNPSALVDVNKAITKWEDAKDRVKRLRDDLASIPTAPLFPAELMGGTAGTATVTETTPEYVNPYAGAEAGFDAMVGRQREAQRQANVDADIRRRTEARVKRETDEWERMRAQQERIDAAYYAKLQQAADKAAVDELTTQMSTWQKATSYLQDYSDRLVGILYGETAMRIAQFDRQRAAERKAFDESIADAELKSEILSAYDADTMAQRAAMGQQEDTRNDERMDMLQQLSQMTGAGSVESLWRKMAESSLQVAFAGPQMPQSPQMIGMGAGMGGDVGGKLQATNATLDKAYEAQAASARSLKSLEQAIAGTQ